MVGLLRDDTAATIMGASIDFQIFEEGLRDEIIRSVAARGAENAVRTFRDCLSQLSERREIRSDLDLDLSARKLTALLISTVLLILLEVGPGKDAFIACVEDEFTRMSFSPAPS